MANSDTAPRWRNFIAWSAVGAISCTLGTIGASLFVSDRGTGALVASPMVMAQLAAALGIASLLVGYTSRNQAFTLRHLRNYVLLNVVALVLFVLALWSFGSAAGKQVMDTMTVSEKVAAILGQVLIALSLLGTFVTALAHKGSTVIDADAREDIRERGRLTLCSFVWIGACGLLMVLLALAGPGGMIAPVLALTGALVLLAVLILLGIAAWRLNDELGRALSREGGEMAFYLILLLGGGWAMLAHLRFVAGPAPIDWLTLFVVLTFAASMIAAARRNLLTR